MESLPGPLAGRLLAPVVGYASRRAAQRQADRWNAALSRRTGPEPEPESDDEQYDVEVGPRESDGTWKLIWRLRP